MKRNVRTQKVEVTLAAGLANNAMEEKTIQFDRKFDRAFEVQAVEMTASGVFYELGILSPRGVEMDLAASAQLTSNDNVAPNMKAKTMDIPVVDGELVTVQLKNRSGAVVPAGGITVQFIFGLERIEANA